MIDSGVGYPQINKPRQLRTEPVRSPPITFDGYICWLDVAVTGHVAQILMINYRSCTGWHSTPVRITVAARDLYIYGIRLVETTTLRDYNSKDISVELALRVC